jgi:hypothetical protein
MSPALAYEGSGQFLIMATFRRTCSDRFRRWLRQLRCPILRRSAIRTHVSGVSARRRGARWGLWRSVFDCLVCDSAHSLPVNRQSPLLLKGSILELVVAVPTHIVARHRDYCCAGFLTFCGIVFGVAVRLLSFGPAVFFLFVDRWKRLHPQAPEKAI